MCAPGSFGGGPAEAHQSGPEADPEPSLSSPVSQSGTSLSGGRDPLLSRPPFDTNTARIWFGWALAGFVAGYVASALLLSVFAAVAGDLKSLGQLESLSVPPWWVTIAGLVGLWMGFIAAIFVTSRTRGSGNPARDFGLRFTRWDPPVGILIGIAGQLIVDLLYLPFEHIDPGLQHQLGEPANRLTGGFHGADLAVIGVLTVVVVPFIEEMFFRGLVLQSLLRLSRNAGRVLGPVIGVVATGILFASAHAEPIQFAGLALFGILLSFMAYKTGRLGSCIFAHAAFNGFAVVAIALQGRISL